MLRIFLDTVRLFIELLILKDVTLQMLCLIGESFDGESVLVNGAVVNVRNRVSYYFLNTNCLNC